LRALKTGCWMFDVGCWMFPIFTSTDTARPNRLFPGLPNHLS
jgi:hypothetical protein